jgi:prepilin-type N-terminal cleavage/methylation domain-containing protein
MFLGKGTKMLNMDQYSNPSKNIHGFSLVELMIAISVMSGIAIVVMKLGTNMSSIQADAFTSVDYVSLRREVDFLLSQPKSCNASLVGLAFHGASIKGTPIKGVELWTGDEFGTRSRKRVYKDQKFGKLTIDEISFSMPDYGAGTDFASGSQSVTAELQITGKKKSSTRGSVDFKAFS